MLKRVGLLSLIVGATVIGISSYENGGGFSNSLVCKMKTRDVRSEQTAIYIFDYEAIYKICSQKYVIYIGKLDSSSIDGERKIMFSINRSYAERDDAPQIDFVSSNKIKIYLRDRLAPNTELSKWNDISIEYQEK